MISADIFQSSILTRRYVELFHGTLSTQFHILIKMKIPTDDYPHVHVILKKNN